LFRAKPRCFGKIEVSEIRCYNILNSRLPGPNSLHAHWTPLVELEFNKTPKNEDLFYKTGYGSLDRIVDFVNSNNKYVLSQDYSKLERKLRVQASLARAKRGNGNDHEQNKADGMVGGLPGQIIPRNLSPPPNYSC